MILGQLLRRDLRHSYNESWDLW